MDREAGLWDIVERALEAQWKGDRSAHRGVRHDAAGDGHEGGGGWGLEEMLEA